MIRQHIRVIFLVFITFVLFGLEGVPAYAVDATPQAQDGGQGSSSGVTNLVAGYGSNRMGQSNQACQDGEGHCNFDLFSQSPSFSSNLFSSLYFNNLFKALAGGEVQDNTTAEGISTLLTATSKNQGDILDESLAIPGPIDSSGDFYSVDIKGKVKSEKAQKDSLNSRLESFSLHALINPLQYAEEKKQSNGELTGVDQKTNALNFIKYVSTQYSPTSVVDFGELNSADLENALKQSDVKQYISKIRQLVTTYSIGINNLTFLYNERVAEPTKNLGVNTPDLPQNLQDEASPLAIDHWMAMRRLTSSSKTDKKSWMAKVENATPATLQREMLYLLAEIRYELYKNRIVNERVLAAASANGIVNAEGNLQLQISSIRRSICNTKPLKGSGACPVSPTVGLGS